jgi:hypothetical protein
MQGAVTGTPGTLPTNWTIPAAAGLTREIVATGTENGVEYIDIKLSGTASATVAQVSPESSTQIVAALNQVWTNSSYLKIIAAPLPPISYSLGFREGLAVGTFVAFGSTAVTPTTTLTRFQATRTLTGVTTERVMPQLTVILVSGSTYDFTIRIGWPQMELGSVATSPIRTTNAAATRNADVISKTGVSGFIGQLEGYLYAEVDYKNLLTTDQVILQLFQDSDNRFGFATFRSGGNNLIQFFCLTSGSVTVNINQIAAAGIYKLAGAYANNDWVFYINGTQVGIDTSSAVPTALDIRLGSNASGVSQFNNRIRAAAIGTTRISNAELAAMTTL